MRQIFFCLLWLLVILIVACDTPDYPTIEPEPSLDELAALAPENRDQKVYVTPATMEYHLANCPGLTIHKLVVAWKTKPAHKDTKPAAAAFLGQ